MGMEIEADKALPKDHPERKKGSDLLEWVGTGGGFTTKLRLRFYESAQRGLHAACNIKAGDAVLTMARDKLLSIDQCANTCPVG